jgi:prophage regulatory protein
MNKEEIREVVAEAMQGVLAEQSFYMTVADVSSLTSLSRTSIYRMAQQGNFPKPIKLGPRQSRWLRSAVVNWAKEQADGL